MHLLMGMHRMTRLGSSLDPTPLRLRIRNVAREITGSTETDLPAHEGQDRFHKIAYYDNPKGHALAMTGFYLSYAGETAYRSGNRRRSNTLFRESLASYLAAAECFAADDDHRCYYLNIAHTKHTSWIKNATAEEVFDVLERLDRAILPTLRIWMLTMMEEDKEKFDAYMEAQLIFSRIQNEMRKQGLEREDLKRMKVVGFSSEYTTLVPL
ncbi:hypothetical protein VKT23_006010 [Stygiomarasmius scandens]|uniref:Uncharacterized protein n=1 Tax=Marasmiellus scandens TaxID=2682957 RepID=A0ABR1JVC9_9AGAR